MRAARIHQQRIGGWRRHARGGWVRGCVTQETTQQVQQMLIVQVCMPSVLGERERERERRERESEESEESESERRVSGVAVWSGRAVGRSRECMCRGEKQGVCVRWSRAARC
jgi:hypothetical protein